MKRKHKILLAVITAILITCTLFTSLTWASISKPAAPEDAIQLWEQTTEAGKTSGVTTLTSDTVLDADYFGAKFIKGITTAEPFGPWDNADIERTIYKSKNLTSLRIPANDFSYKEHIGMFYRNVGNYQGHSIDLKATLANYDFYANDGVTSSMIFWGMKDRIGFCVAGESWIDIRYEFFDSETGQPISLKAYMTFDDVDWGQAISILSNPGQLYIPENSNLRCLTTPEGSLAFLSDSAWYDDTSASSHTSSPEDSFMTMFQGNTQLQRFYCGYYFREGYVSRLNFLADYQDETKLQSFCKSLDYFSYSGEPLAPTEPSTPTKQVMDEDEEGTSNTLYGISEAFSYSIYHNIPNENPEHYYSSYQMTDTLPDCLELVSASVFDESNNEVTSYFDISFVNQTVTFTLSEPARANFYYNTYRYVIDVKIRKNADLSSYLMQNSDDLWMYAFSNTGSVTIERNGTITKDTNETTTYLQHLFNHASLTIHKLDAINQTPLTSAVFTLYEWNRFEHAYLEKTTLTFDDETDTYHISDLYKDYVNLGKYKIVETQLPEKYEGKWEQEFEITKDKQVFTFEALNMPQAENIIAKTAVILKGDVVLLKNPGTKKEPIAIEQGDIIEYRINVTRNCAPGYKSGTFTVTDQIPSACIWNLDTLKITGQFSNLKKDSTASIDDMNVKGNTVTWTITDLDDGESAELSFQVQAPKKAVLIKNIAYLNFPNIPKIASNPTYHQTQKKQTIVAPKQSSNTSSNTQKNTLSPVTTGDSTLLIPISLAAFLSGLGMVVLLLRKLLHR